MTPEQLIDLAATPDNIWRVVVSTMTHYFNHPGANYDPPPIVKRVFGDKPLDPADWQAIYKEVATLRYDAACAAIGERKLTRSEYMKLYMKKRRLGV